MVNRHQDQLCIIITSLVMNGQVEGSLISNLKIIRQGYVIYFNIFEFYDLNYVENDTNCVTLSHLHQKISRLTNNGKNGEFWPPSCTFDVMTYVMWQRQDDVTYVKMCLPSLVTDTMRRFLRLESSKKLQGKNARGVVSTFLGVRLLILAQHIILCESLLHVCLWSLFHNHVLLISWLMWPVLPISGRLTWYY